MNFDACDLHVPHKDWATPEEWTNYSVIEQWATRLPRRTPPALSIDPRIPVTGTPPFSQRIFSGSYTAGSAGGDLDFTLLTEATYFGLGSNITVTGSPGRVHIFAHGLLAWTISFQCPSGFPVGAYLSVGIQATAPGSSNSGFSVNRSMTLPAWFTLSGMAYMTAAGHFRCPYFITNMTSGSTVDLYISDATFTLLEF